MINSERGSGHIPMGIPDGRQQELVYSCTQCWAGVVLL